MAVTLAGATCPCGAIQGAEPETSRAPQTYYVAPTGSDGNPGTTQAKPWQTISKVSKAALQPGDSVLLEGGKSFAGNLLITASGNAKAFITIGSYGAGPATIQAGDSFGIRLLNCQYIKVHDLILEGSGVKPDGTTTNKEQGLDIYSDAKEGAPWQSIYVEKIAVSGFHDGIVLHTPIGTQKVVGYNDVRISNCTVKECLYSGILCWGSEKASGKPWFFPLGSGLFTNCYLGGCTVHDIYGDPNGNPGYCVPVQITNATSFLVEHCTIYDCGQAGRDNGQPGGVGGLVFLECEKSVGQFNECYRIVTNQRMDGCAFDIDGGCSNCILQYNYSHDNEGSGFQTGFMIGAGPVRDNIIRYNISQNDAKKNPSASGGIMTWGVQSGYVYNNPVFVSAGIGGTKPAAFLGNTFGGQNGVTVFNNIFVANHDGDIINSNARSTFRNNCYYRVKGDFRVTYAGKGYTTLEEWQDATEQEKLDGAAVGFSVDPLLKAPGSGGDLGDAGKLAALKAYDLLPGSPLIGKSIDVNAVFPLDPSLRDVRDFRGTPLPSGAKPDLGAVQHTTNNRAVYNQGRCGQNSGILRSKFDADVLKLTPKPDCVLIFIGMNDVINDKFFTPLDKYLENMTWMIEQARKEGITPVICTMHHVVEDEVYKHHSRDKFGTETVNGKMDRYNAALMKLATEQKVDLADFSAVTAKLAPSEFLSDGVHLTLSGNKLLAKTFFDIITPHLRGQETIVCVGDSLTYGYLNKGAGTSEGETYPSMLRLLLMTSGISVEP